MSIEHLLRFLHEIIGILGFLGVVTIGGTSFMLRKGPRSRMAKFCYAGGFGVGVVLLSPLVFETTMGGLGEKTLNMFSDHGNVGLAEDLLRAGVAEADEARKLAKKAKNDCPRERAEACERIYQSELRRIEKKYKRAERAAFDALSVEN